MASIREILELLKKGATLEAQQQIVELQEAHIATREESIRLREEIARLKTEIREAAALSCDEPYYFKTVDRKRDGPFCQMGKGTEDKMIGPGAKLGNEPALSLPLCGIQQRVRAER